MSEVTSMQAKPAKSPKPVIVTKPAKHGKRVTIASLFRETTDAEEEILANRRHYNTYYYKHRDVALARSAKQTEHDKGFCECCQMYNSCLRKHFKTNAHKKNLEKLTGLKNKPANAVSEK